MGGLGSYGGCPPARVGGPGAAGRLCAKGGGRSPGLTGWGRGLERVGVQMAGSRVGFPLQSLSGTRASGGIPGLRRHEVGRDEKGHTTCSIKVAWDGA